MRKDVSVDTPTFYEADIDDYNCIVMEQNDPVHVIVVEGNISSGKTTMMEHLVSKGYTCYPENVAEWMPYLEELYNSDEKQTDMLQMRITLDQFKILKNIQNLKDVKRLPNGKKVVFIERWIGASEDVFIKGAMNAEYTTITPKGIKMWRDLVELSGLRDLKIDAFIYIHSEPKEAHARILKRAQVRKSERSVAYDYVESIHNLYESYMSKCDNVITIYNTDATKEDFCKRAYDVVVDSLHAM
jgi:deoxyadenosine/deoxycytidine kinase